MSILEQTANKEPQEERLYNTRNSWKIKNQSQQGEMQTTAEVCSQMSKSRLSRPYNQQIKCTKQKYVELIDINVDNIKITFDISDNEVLMVSCKCN